ncbi:MAG TPA: hypothetical protein VGR39_02455 [Candidatus Acidoferrales bacterium]|nr:hypothetical protein [Candidatus Acidoferrales bacterium]
MRLPLGMILLVFALLTQFPGRNSKTLRERYGAPIAETFLVRPGVVVTASYGESGQTCEMVISPKVPGLIKTRNSTIDEKLIEKIADELVPASERGKPGINEFDDITCLPEDDCQGATENWKDVRIYRNSGQRGVAYATIQWNRAECQSQTK